MQVDLEAEKDEPSTWKAKWRALADEYDQGGAPPMAWGGVGTRKLPASEPGVPVGTLAFYVRIRIRVVIEAKKINY